jgi:hypothetical protein
MVKREFCLFSLRHYSAQVRNFLTGATTHLKPVLKLLWRHNSEDLDFIEILN